MRNVSCSSQCGCLTRFLIIASLSAGLLIPSARAHAQCDGTWVPRSSATKPAPRSQPAMAFDSGRGVTVLFGGRISGSEDNETWEWNGSDWLLKSPTNAPSPRLGAAMAYDSARGVTVLFGGDSGATSNEPDNETWEWDGADWLQRTPATSPPALFDHVMVYDSARGVAVLFGGFDELFITHNETWEWDGTNWTNRNPTIAPPPVALPTMAYDVARGETVLFSGALATGSVLSLSADTWIWNGTNWSQRLSAASPSPRAAHSMVYDTNRQRTVLYGGLLNSNPDLSDETWEWDGVNWVLSQPLAPPPARAGHVMAYDVDRHVIVLFGGEVVGSLIDETRELTHPEILVSELPSDQVVLEGESATFSTAASSGAIELTYAWRHDGNLLTDGGPISGASTPTLTITAASLADAGSYDCQISHLCQSVNSSAAALVVTALFMEAAPLPMEGVSAPCGLCGTGSSAMMPLALLWLGSSVRRRRTHKGR